MLPVQFDSTLPQEAEPGTRPAVACERNTELLIRLLAEIADLRELLVTGSRASGDASALLGELPETEVSEESSFGAVDAENLRLRFQVDQLQAEFATLQQQNDELTARADRGQAENVGEHHASEAQSWEERKQAILDRMEDGSFDADEFVKALGEGSIHGPDQVDPDQIDPLTFVEHLYAELQTSRDALVARDDELAKLRQVAGELSETRTANPVSGANASSAPDHEPGSEATQSQPAGWEDQVRQGEVAVSLERAQLSRERRELANLKAQVEDELAKLQRAARDIASGKNVASRRWLAELGISELDT